MNTVPVLAAPALDPGAARIDVTLPEGLNIAEIVETTLPSACEADLAHARITLVGPRGAQVVERTQWHRVRPKPGIRVVIRLIPGEDALRTILSIVVAVTAVALGTMFGPAVGGLLGLAGKTGAAIGTALVTAGANLLGALLINALIPPAKPEKERPSYSLSGWRNRLDPDGAIPVLLGQIRYAPPFGALTWTEIAGDTQYLHALFCFGEGPLELTDFRLGETSIADFDEIELEVRQGLDDDDPISLYPRQILEEQIGVELTRPLPRDDLGDVIKGEPAIETPVVRTTGTDASGVSIILAFPTGLVRYNDEGKQRVHSVSVKIEQRLVTAEEWTDVLTLELSAKKSEGFYRQHNWSFPERGRWQIRLTLMTDEIDQSNFLQRVVWAGLQTIRPEYPLNYHRPLAIVGVRAKATHQLSGALDNFSALARRVCLDWDHETETWIERATSNPASLFRFILQCPANPKPEADAAIDLDLLTEWHDFCRLKGLHYNRVLEEAGMTLRDALTEVAVAGRATPRHDGIKWGVVIDRPSELIVDHLTPRNSWGFSLRRSYAEKPHAWLASFRDEDNDYKPATRTIRRPGYEGDITLTEPLSLPGLTNAAIVYREGLRRFFEAEHRPDTFEATQDGALRAATRGDTIVLSHDVVSDTQKVGRARAVIGQAVHLDEAVTMAAGTSYVIRFRMFDENDPEDTVGTSVVRPVRTTPGASDMLLVEGVGAMPRTGDLVIFGVAGTESFPVVVSRIEATEDQCTILRAVAAAPEIDTLTDAAEIPPWSSRVGAEIDPNLLAPPSPTFTAVTSERASGSWRIAFLIAPGSGTIVTTGYRIGYRLGSSGAWTEVDIPAANGGGEVGAFSAGDAVEIRANALSFSDTVSPATAPVSLVIGTGDAAIPAALEDEAVTVTPLLGGALVQVATGADPVTTRLQLYRSTSDTLDRDTDAVGTPHLVDPTQSYSFALGDTTRSTLLTNGGLASETGWTLGANWTIAAGVASHNAGAADAISQARATTTGKWYRLGVTISDSTAGTVTPRLTGGSTVPGAALAANDAHRARLQAVTGNDTFEFLASSDFDGSIDDAVLFLETAACLSQGTHYIWVEPQNEDGVPGPVAGPFPVTIT
ncbi:phage tail protein [Rhodobacter sp. NTK016B]|uniref:TipJ family phage tail tip protein n=1 Tax=Rhodobacter sp. NTK016B TaxID=2759676 RepID=UPI001A8F20D6|nr:phage tail protein [Rhodobacter sp. NTK016B]MBN8294742.1 phage tail protein [Rhodobacter sp. NTK016B]